MEEVAKEGHVDTWTPVDEDAGLWTWGARSGGVVMLRSTAIKLKDGAMAVVGPILQTPRAAFEQLEAIGKPDIFLAPNHYHNMGLDRWLSRYEGSIAVAAEGARARIAGRVPHPIGSLDALAQRLPEHAELVTLPASRAGEVWLKVQTRDGVAWIVGDSFCYIPQMPKNAMGFVTWALGCGPGLRLSQSFKWWALLDRQVYGHWLKERIDADKPTVLVPAHGDVLLDNNLPQQLAALCTHRLDIRPTALGPGQSV